MDTDEQPNVLPDAVPQHNRYAQPDPNTIGTLTHDRDAESRWKPDRFRVTVLDANGTAIAYGDATLSRYDRPDGRAHEYTVRFTDAVSTLGGRGLLSLRPQPPTGLAPRSQPHPDTDTLPDSHALPDVPTGTDPDAHRHVHRHPHRASGVGHSLPNGLAVDSYTHTHHHAHAGAIPDDRTYHTDHTH